jgi:hypothetical protein
VAESMVVLRPGVGMVAILLCLARRGVFISVGALRVGLVGIRWA